MKPDILLIHNEFLDLCMHVNVYINISILDL
jgi:hypothetical protein